MATRIFTACLLFVSIAQAVAGERPNVLMIVSEDNGPELGCYGEPYVKTPTLDRLAAQGVRFERAFVPQAGCSQSRAAYLTGLFPHQNGQIGLATWKFRMYRDDTPNLVRSLKEAGYRTGILGKLHVNPASAFPFDMAKLTSSNFARKKLAQYAKEAQAFIESGDEPFFLSVNYPDAHRPFLKQVAGSPRVPLTGSDVRPLNYFGVDSESLRSDTANYYNCLSRLDDLIGDLLEALDRSGKAENTLVLYFGDHGADLLRGKRTCYEGGLRVPLIVRWPDGCKQGLVRDELVSTLDLLPTLLSVTKADPIDHLPGRSLVPLLKGDSPPWREYLFAEYHLHSAHNFYPQRCVRTDRYKLIENLLPDEINPGYEFTARRFFEGLEDAIAAARPPVPKAYATMKKPPRFELYDLRSDPHEFQNLAGDAEHEPVLQNLKKRLRQWRNRTADPLLDPENLRMLRAEIDACRVDGEPTKSRLSLHYPDYFMD